MIRNILYTDSSNFILILVVNIIAVLLIKLYRYLIKNNKDLYRKTGKGFSLTWSLILLLIIGVILLILSFADATDRTENNTKNKQKITIICLALI